MKKRLKITPIKGRPMLHWVGKKPLDAVRHFPAQLCEVAGAAKAPRGEMTYDAFAKSGCNLLYHGDNKEVLSSLLVAGFRGKVDLVYIDPPFDSGADYVRQVKLRGAAGGGGKLAGAGQASVEQAQYEDIWANDNYLQFMFERLILLRELLSERGGIYLHCDWHKSHHLRFLLDEVFGAENFVNEIAWKKLNSPKAQTVGYGNQKDSILLYHKGDGRAHKIHRRMDEVSLRPYSHDDGDGKGKYRLIEIEAQGIQKTPGRKEFSFKGYTTAYLYSAQTLNEWDQQGLIYTSKTGRHSKKQYLSDVSGILVSDLWVDDEVKPIQSAENIGFPTQKPEALLARIIQASSDEGDLVLDCFCGSGTTAAVAEKLGRRWIMADINKGAIQTAIKRVQKVADGKNGDLAEKNGGGVLHYRVNNYDCAKDNGLKKLIVAKYGIQNNLRDPFFNGTVGGNLAKIVDLDKPLTRLDVQIIRDEIAANRPDEVRHIEVFCNGAEVGLLDELARQKSPINRIIAHDIQQDGMYTEMPAEADVQIDKSGKTATVKIVDYISPAILARMEIDRSVFGERIADFRAQIDYVLLDNDYNGAHFNIVQSDLPRKKADLVKGEYALPLPRAKAKVAVKIVDMLGEETLAVA